MEGIVLNMMTSIPICTRVWTTSILLASFLVSANAVNNVDLVFVTSFYSKREFWRIITSFVYFGPFDINLLNWLIHISQHSSTVESSFFKTRDYLWYMFLNMTIILLYSNYIETSFFLGPELVVSTTYYWCRKNPNMTLSLFFGLINFKAENYPLSIILFGILRKGFTRKLLNEFSGLLAGHFMFYFEEVFEKMFGFNPLIPPWEYFQNNTFIYNNNSNNNNAVDNNANNDANEQNNE